MEHTFWALLPPLVAIVVSLITKEVNLLSNSSPTLETEITSISFNSKEVKKGGLFICKGDHFNSEYLIEAVDAGAVVYLAEEKYELPPSKEIPGVIVKKRRTGYYCRSEGSIFLYFRRLSRP